MDYNKNLELSKPQNRELLYKTHSKLYPVPILSEV